MGLVRTGTGARGNTGNELNVPLSDPRIVKAGIDPASLHGKGISESELRDRMRSRGKGKGR